MKADHIVEALTGDSGWKHMIPQVDSSDFPTQWVSSAYECSIIDAQAKEIEKLRAQLRHLEELAEADKDGRLLASVQGGGHVIQSVRRRNLRAQSQQHEIPRNTGTVGH